MIRTANHMRVMLVFASILASLSVVSSAYAQLHEVDFALTLVDAKITVGIVDLEGNPVFADPVLQGAFGDSGFAGYTADPGFDSFPGTWPIGTSLGFNFLQPLKLWIGDGFIDLDPATEETVTFQYGPPPPIGASTTTGAGFVEGFTLNVASDGSYHRHYNMYISDDARSGIYLIEIEKFSTAPNIATSDPIWLVMLYDADHTGGTLSPPHALLADHDDAYQYVLTVIIPEPASVAFLALGGLMLMGSRKLRT